MNKRLVLDALQLSSGTIGTLTGMSLYTQIDEVQAEFVRYCEVGGFLYGTWQRAWEDFWEAWQDKYM